MSFYISIFSSIFISAIFAVSGVYIERKKSYALEMQKQQAEEDVFARNTFLSNMGHELRTPLNSILNAVKFLQKQPLSAMQLEYLHIIQFCGQHISGLTNDILDHKKIEAGHFHLNYSIINLRLTLQQAVLSFLNDFYDKGVELKIDIDEELDLHVEADEMRLVQVVNNLLSNALKFTPSGYVKFSAKTVHLKENMVKLTISVKDTGIGISAENQKKIFTSFWKLKNRQEKIQQQGAGLGLSITQKLLNLMYTNLLVDSAEGKGSTFYFTIDLPVFRNNNNVFEAKNYKEQSIKLNGLKVLVAEDNKLTMLLTTRILEEAGATVVSTYNGKATLHKLTEESDFNMILLDLNMPEIDGYTVMETINEKYSHIPTLAFTANLLNNDMYQRLLKQGFLDCILKPYEPEELLITVKRFATKKANL